MKTTSNSKQSKRKKRTQEDEKLVFYGIGRLCRLS